MRIISGKYGGRILRPPANFRARPTTDMAREGLFNILSNRLDLSEVKVLDLFAGTGSVGLEFLSRGAERVMFIESNFVHFSFIRDSLRKLEIGNAAVYRQDVFRVVPKIKERFDLIFADPPYDLKKLADLPELILGNELLRDGGMFILEHPGTYSFSSLENFLEHRHYGSVNFSFFRRD